MSFLLKCHRCVALSGKNDGVARKAISPWGERVAVAKLFGETPRPRPEDAVRTRWKPDFLFYLHMNKIVLLIVALAVLGTGGWYGYQQYRVIRAKQVEKARVADAEAKQKAAQAAADSTRRDVEAQLKPMKVSSIMPGQPGIVIIDKKEYTEGDRLTLPRGGKQLQIAKVRDDGILLAYNGLTFRLDPPAEPDLAASRKK